MDWQHYMAYIEAWLWQTPYLDVPNYAWLATGLGLLVLVLYLVLVFSRTRDLKQEEVQEEGTLPAEPEAGAETTDEEPAAAEAAKAEVPAPEPVETPPPSKPATESPPEPEAPEETPAPEAPAAEVPADKLPPEEVEVEPPEGWFQRLKKGLSKTQGKLSQGLSRLLSGKVSEDTLEELEELLVSSDLGVKTSMSLLERLETAIKEEGLEEGEQVRQWLKDHIREILEQVEEPLLIPADREGPYVIMVTGVNGTGKTTTIGKLAMHLGSQGKSVIIGAADTFRAAAVEQLEVWGQRAGAPVIKHQEGADPGAVAFDTVQAAQARKADVAIIDTAGRLHTKSNLMDELKKVKRVAGKECEGAPHEILLVLDATTGQNAVQQARMFNQALELSGLIMTKLDGTAKGGILVAISDEFKIPVRYIGVGEKIYDLQPFRAKEFVDAIFS
ncbi:MAG: signal recognition particle-docking protein FtsY [bacterium]